MALTISPELLRPARTRISVRSVVRWLPALPLVILLLIALVGPTMLPFDPARTVDQSSIPPGGTYWFGTDASGLDVYSRTIAATRLDLIIAGSVTLLATAGGCALGLLLGMNESHGGVPGLGARGVSRLLDLLQAVPPMLVGLVVVAFFGTSTLTIVLAIAVILLPLQARLVRTETMRVRSEAYLDAARLAGESELGLTRRHVLPNAIDPALTNLSLIFAVAIIITAGLGFVGAGVPPPTAEWGAMIAAGAADVQAGRWWAATFPSLALALSVAAVAMANQAFLRHRRR